MTDPMDAPRQCTAKSKQSGKRCKRSPIVGGTVCAMHGGKSPVVVAAAERRLEERRAILALESFGLPRQVDPHTALLEELHRTAGAVEWLGAVVGGLEREGSREGSGVIWGAGTSDARPSTWVSLWQGERKHLAQVAKTCVDVGIEERRVRLAEESGRQLAGVVRAVLDRLGLSDEQQQLAVTVVPEEFRRVLEGPSDGASSGGAA